MNTSIDGQTLLVTGLQLLIADTVADIRRKVTGDFTSHLTDIRIVVSELTMIDSSGIGLLISLHKLACGRGGQLQIASPNEKVLLVLQVTRLDQAFEILP